MTETIQIISCFRVTRIIERLETRVFRDVEKLGKRENLKKQEKQDKYSHKKDDKPIKHEDTKESDPNASTYSFVGKETELPLTTYGETDMSMNISQDNELDQNENEAMQQDTHSLNSWNTKL